ncbi:MAG: response regulator transcription factor [Vicinamibacterales bacterium]
MQIIIADDDPISQRLATHALGECGVSVLRAHDGDQAWASLVARQHPTLLILDRMMPGLDGLEICRRARLEPSTVPLYIVMVTSATQPSDVTDGLDAGADDYIKKPFHLGELKARANVGLRMLALQESLSSRVVELEEALTNVKQLRGLLPICAYCKRVRVDDTYWQQVEGYVADHSDAQFTHGICPTCFPAVMEQAENP